MIRGAAITLTAVGLVTMALGVADAAAADAIPAGDIQVAWNMPGGPQDRWSPEQTLAAVGPVPTCLPVAGWLQVDIYRDSTRHDRAFVAHLIAVGKLTGPSDSPVWVSATDVYLAACNTSTPTGTSWPSTPSTPAPTPTETGPTTPVISTPSPTTTPVTPTTPPVVTSAPTTTPAPTSTSTPTSAPTSTASSTPSSTPSPTSSSSTPPSTPTATSSATASAGPGSSKGGTPSPGETLTVAPSGGEHSTPSALAFTGSNPGPILAFGTLAMLAGAVLTVIARRRRAS